MRKIDAYHKQQQLADDSEEQRPLLLNYLDCVMQANHIFLYQFIFNGYTFVKLQENPIVSQDPMHGQPPLWTMILNKVAEEQDMMENAALEQELGCDLSRINESKVIIEDEMEEIMVGGGDGDNVDEQEVGQMAADMVFEESPKKKNSNLSTPEIPALSLSKLHK